MAYFLMAGNARNGIKINISKLPGFEECKSNSLKQIVDFTNEFENASDLTEFLKDSGVIGMASQNVEYGIYKRRKDEDGNYKTERLRYGISYKPDAKYFDPEYLESYFSNKMYSVKFLTAFVNKYYSIYKARMENESLPSIHPLHLMQSIYNGYGYYKDHGIFIYEADKLIMDFVKNYSKDYTHRRDLAMFVIDYERKQKELEQEKEHKEEQVDINEENEIKDNLERIQQLKQELEHYKYILRMGDITLEQKQEYENFVQQLENRIEDERLGR